jgi:hypothetical protein
MPPLYTGSLQATRTRIPKIRLFRPAAQTPMGAFARRGEFPKRSANSLLGLNTSLRAHFLLVSHGRDACRTSKKNVQMALAAKANRIGNIGDGELGVTQHYLRTLDALFDLELMRPLARRLLERGAEVARRKPDEIGEFGQRDIAMQIVLQVVYNALQPNIIECPRSVSAAVLKAR